MRTHDRVSTAAKVAALCIGAGFAAVPGLLSTARASQQQPTTGTTCGPAGRHALLERMAIAFGLSCDQKFQIEPLLHDEESVSKPLLRFAAFTPEEKRAVMLEVKVAARRQILPLLAPKQQKKMQQEIQTVSSGGAGLQGSHGNKGHTRKSEQLNADTFEAEESLSQAIENYSALTPEQKTHLILKVKQASLEYRDSPMTAGQKDAIQEDIRKLAP